MSNFLSAAGEFIGGAIDYSSARSSRKAAQDAAAQQFAQTEKWNKINQENWERQFETAIQTRVNDARAAGIAPLAAMGMPASSGPASFSIAQQSRAGGKPSFGDAVRNVSNQLALMQQKANIEKTNAETKNLEIGLKSAQTRYLNAQSLDMLTQGVNRNLFVQAIDNNPKSPSYGEKIWIVEPEIAEGLEGMGALGLSAYSNLTDRTPNPILRHLLMILDNPEQYGRDFGDAYRRKVWMQDFRSNYQP